MSIADCIDCKRRTHIIDGQIYCTIDRRTIHAHNEADICPEGKFGTHAIMPPADPHSGEPKTDQPIVPRDPTAQRGCCGQQSPGT